MVRLAALIDEGMVWSPINVQTDEDEHGEPSVCSSSIVTALSE